jgi:CheY-like chemotaxis protein
MTPLTSRDDVRKAASEILKRVDQLIKAGEIDRSVREIIQAKEIDPTNVYIHAYEERLAYLKEEHEKNTEREKTKTLAKEAARQRDAELQREQEKEQQRRKEELARKETEQKKQEERAHKETEQKNQEERARKEAEQKKQEEHAKADQERVRSVEIPIPGPSPAANVVAERRYAEAFRKAWTTGTIAPLQVLALQKLRTETGISPERALQIDSEILAEIQTKSLSETILVIDDDEEMLKLITELLSLHGYQVTALTTTDEAYALLKKWKPRLILCDVNLENSTMGGFSFFEKVRALKNLADVPFVFLTGLSDEAIIRAGKELGVDDYLTKPVSEENLIATVKGKLKRFGKLRE